MPALRQVSDVADSAEVVTRLAGMCEQRDGAQRLICTCAPVRDFTGQEVARVGLFEHAPNDGSILTEHNRRAWELARLISSGPSAGPVCSRHSVK